MKKIDRNLVDYLVTPKLRYFLLLLLVFCGFSYFCEITEFSFYVSYTCLLGIWGAQWVLDSLFCALTKKVKFGYFCVSVVVACFNMILSLVLYLVFIEAKSECFEDLSFIFCQVKTLNIVCKFSIAFLLVQGLLDLPKRHYSEWLSLSWSCLIVVLILCGVS